MKKTKRTPSPRTKPNHVGPVGRKMWAELPQIFTAIPQVFHNSKPLTSEPMRVLVIPLDPANVERIRDIVALEMFGLGGVTMLDKIEPRIREILFRRASDVLAALGLTPAKRKGRKAQ